MPPPAHPFRAAPWQIRYLFDLGFQGWLIHIGVVLLTGWLLISANAGLAWPFAWTGLMLVLSLLMALLSKTHASAALRSDDDHIRAGWVHTGLTALVGLTWGAGALVVHANGDFNVLAMYSLALGGTALGAVSSQHAVPRSAFTSIWTSVPLLALAHVFEAHDPAMGAMVLLYALILSILTIRMHRFLATNFTLAQSLDGKVAELTLASAELVQAREEAENANLSKSRFLAQASHDLRQPIHAIGLLTASLKDTRLTREQAKIVTSIEASVDSVTNLFGALLDISRLDVGGVVVKTAPFSLGDFLERVVAQNRDMAQKSGCALLAVPTRAWIDADSNLLFTMVQNVLSNAFKYAPDSRVLIGTRRKGNGLALHILDTGPGIEACQLGAVFDEFYRLEKPVHGAAIEGMGLGLAIVRGLAELQGLEVRLTSTPGRGTAVMIAGLPLTQPTRDGATRQGRTHPLSGKRICLIDDDDVVREATAALLERWGCQVVASRDGVARDLAFDAVLADMHLGQGRSGIEIVQDLRERARRPIPAVILTGHGSAEARRLISEARLPVLEKPVRPADLRATLTRLCLGIEGLSPPGGPDIGTERHARDRR